MRKLLQLLSIVMIIFATQNLFGAEASRVKITANTKSSERKEILNNRAKENEELKKSSYLLKHLAGKEFIKSYNAAGGVLFRYTDNGKKRVFLLSERGVKDHGQYGPLAGSGEGEEDYLTTAAREAMEEGILDVTLGLKTMAEVKKWIEANAEEIIANEIGNSVGHFATTIVVNFDKHFKDYPKAFYAALKSELYKTHPRDGFTGKEFIASVSEKNYKKVVGFAEYREDMFIDAMLFNENGDSQPKTIQLRNVAHNQLKHWALGSPHVTGRNGFSNALSPEVQIFGWKINEKIHEELFQKAKDAY